MINIKITKEPIDITSCLDWATSPHCGGSAIFLGTVRDKTQERKVLQLEFECYEKMALKKMQEIAIQSIDTWHVQKILIHHRIGRLGITDAAVLIIAAAPHRNNAFAACQYAIDTLKKIVPIWKKEIFEDGEVWVAAHP
jgi:molybdopterin synthase catalytic subunit